MPDIKQNKDVEKWYKVSFICNEEHLNDMSKCVILGRRQDYTVKELKSAEVFTEIK